MNFISIEEIMQEQTTQDLLISHKGLEYSNLPPAFTSLMILSYHLFANYLLSSRESSNIKQIATISRRRPFREYTVRNAQH